MAIPEQSESNLVFNKVTADHESAGGSNRLPAGATVLRTGFTTLNVEGSELASELFKPDLGKEENTDTVQLLATYGANEGRMEVAIYRAQPDELKPKPVHYNKNTRTYNFHLGATFKQYPALRPIGKRECTVRLARDAEGRACLVISLGAGTVKRTTSRQSGDGTADVATMDAE